MRLRDRRLGHQECARDFRGGQSTEETQRQGDARLGCEDGMTRDEHQAKHIVADIVIQRGDRIWRRQVLSGLDLRAQFSELASQP